jgi:hypothetical protein
MGAEQERIYDLPGILPTNRSLSPEDLGILTGRRPAAPSTAAEQPARPAEQPNRAAPPVRATEQSIRATEQPIFPPIGTSETRYPVDNSRKFEQNRPSDRINTRERTLSLRYGDPDFDKKLAAGGIDTLQLNNVPAEVSIATWADSNGFYFYFKNGGDNNKPHYIPGDLKSIASKNERRDVGDMQAETYLAMREPRAPKHDVAVLKGSGDPVRYAFGMSNLTSDMLDRMEKTYSMGAAQFPNNPYFHLRLSEAQTWDAMKPIREQVLAGSNVVDLNNPLTMQRLQAAQQSLVQAERIAREQNNPFAAAQAQQRQVLLQQLPLALQSAPRLELPPAGTMPRMPSVDPYDINAVPRRPR